MEVTKEDSKEDVDIEGDSVEENNGMEEGETTQIISSPVETTAMAEEVEAGDIIISITISSSSSSINAAVEDFSTARVVVEGLFIVGEAGGTGEDGEMVEGMGMGME